MATDFILLSSAKTLSQITSSKFKAFRLGFSIFLEELLHDLDEGQVWVVRDNHIGEVLAQ
jgi:hypothetical protein